MAERSNTPLAEETAAQAAERIYHEWDAALGAKDLDGAMRLYALDCLLESPLGNPEHGNGIAKDSSRTGIS